MYTQIFANVPKARRNGDCENFVKHTEELWYSLELAVKRGSINEETAQAARSAIADAMAPVAAALAGV